MKLRSIELALPGASEAARFMTEIWGLALGERRGETYYLRGSGAFPYLVSLAEAKELLTVILDQYKKPEHQVRFSWRPGSIAFWDNRSAQHQAIWDYFPATRSGVRVTVAGDRPF